MAGTEKLTYANPRETAEFSDWPMGRNQRATAYFWIERDKLGRERMCRRTNGAATKLTYAEKMRVVDGSDGKTYIASQSFYGHVTIKHSNMKYDHETVHEGDPRWPALAALFEGKPNG